MQYITNTTKTEVVKCLQALSRLDGATISLNNRDFILKNIDEINEFLLKLLNEVPRHVVEVGTDKWVTN